MQTVPTLDDNYIERTNMTNTEDISPKLTLDLIKRLEDKLAFLDHCNKDYYYAPELLSSLYNTEDIFRLVHIEEGDANILIDRRVDTKDLSYNLMEKFSKLKVDIFLFAARSKPYVSNSDSHIRKMLYLYSSNIPFDVNQYTDHIQRILDIKEEEPDKEQLAEEAKKLVDRFNKLYAQYTEHQYHQEPPKTIKPIEPSKDNTNPYLGTIHFLFIVLILFAIMALLPK